MKISGVIALLLAPASGTKLQQSMCSETESTIMAQTTTPVTLAQTTQEPGPMQVDCTKLEWKCLSACLSLGECPFPTSVLAQTEQVNMPSTESINKVGIYALRQLGSSLRQQRRQIERAVNQVEQGLQSGGRAVGVKFDPQDEYPPSFVADMISAEYDDYVNRIAENGPRGFDKAMYNLTYDARRNIGFAQQEDDEEQESQEEGEELAQQEERKRGRRERRRRRPSEMCEERKSGQDTVTCQIMQQGFEQGLPRPDDVFRQWIDFLNGATHEFADHPDRLERDIGAFNELLRSEAARLKVEAPKSLPDPKKLVEKFGKLFNGLKKVSIENKRQAIRQIQYLETQIAQQIANVYVGATRGLSDFSGVRIKTQSLPDSQRDLMALGEAVLVSAQKANDAGYLNSLYRDIESLFKEAGVDSNETPTAEELQMLVSGLIDSGAQYARIDLEQGKDKAVSKCKGRSFWNAQSPGPGEGNCENCEDYGARPANWNNRSTVPLLDACFNTSLNRDAAIRCGERCLELPPGVDSAGVYDWVQAEAGLAPRIK